MPEVNEAIVATYLAGGNTRRIRGALQPLLKAAPLSKSAVSRVIATLKDGLEAWRTRSLTDLDVIYVYLDGFALRMRRGGKVTPRTTNVIERLHEAFRRRVKTQGSLPSEDAALILLFSLVVSGQIKLRRIDGWRKIAAVLTERTSVAA
jgi:transposase-like protein